MRKPGGKTRQEAIENIKEAIEAWVSVLEEDGLPIPGEKYEALLVAV
jgi:predicted RNase H-like HicB family nuclease